MKRSKPLLRVLLALILGFCPEAGFLALAQQLPEPKPLPVLGNVGVVPLRWEGSGKESKFSEGARQSINETFIQAVQSSKRLRLINQTLVDDMWNSVEGRRELVEEYENGGFVGLSVAESEDALRFVTRLLGPGLENYLLETESFRRDEFLALDEAARKTRMENLVYRMLNRLPVDATILAIQGNYVTLAGGREQSVFVGQDLELLRSYIVGLHPADKSWLDFKSDKIGQVRVVEVKENTSVAQIKELIRSDVLEVGDGAKIPTITTRQRFQRLDRAPEQPATSAPAIVLKQGELQSVPAPAPQKRGGHAKPMVTDIKPAPKHVAANEEDAEKEGEVEDAPAVSEEEADEEATPVTGHEGPGILTDIQKQMQYASGEIGPRSWSVSGPVSAKTKLPMILVNHIGGAVQGGITPMIRHESGGGLEFGDTKSGNFSGLYAFSRFLFNTGFDLRSMMGADLRLGAETKLETMGVSSEAFGGLDQLVLGGFVGLAGQSFMGPYPIDWFADFYLQPLRIGFIGYDGSRKTLGSSLTYGLRAQGYIEDKQSDYEYGAGFLWANTSFTAGSDKLSMSDMALLFCLRYKMKK